MKSLFLYDAKVTCCRSKDCFHTQTNFGEFVHLSECFSEFMTLLLVTRSGMVGVWQRYFSLTCVCLPDLLLRKYWTMSKPVSDFAVFQQNILIYKPHCYEVEMYFYFSFTKASSCNSPRARSGEGLVPQSSHSQHSLGLSPQRDSPFISA